MTRTTVSQADLGDEIQEIIDRVQRGEIVVVESSGQEQAVVLDSLDFRLLEGLAQCAIGRAGQGQEVDDPDVRALRDYLNVEISLTRLPPQTDRHARGSISRWAPDQAFGKRC